MIPVAGGVMVTFTAVVLSGMHVRVWISGGTDKNKTSPVLGKIIDRKTLVEGILRVQTMNREADT